MLAGGPSSPKKDRQRGGPAVSAARVQGVQPGDIVDKVGQYKLHGAWPRGVARANAGGGVQE